MTRLKKLLLALLASTLALFGTIGVYGVGSNPYSSNLDSSTMNALDNIIDLVERKGQSLSTQSYYNLISALSNRLRYLDYELLSIRNSLGGNSNGGTTTVTTCEWGYRGVSPAPPAPARDCRCGETVTVGGGVYECYENTVTVPVNNPTPNPPISNNPNPVIIPSSCSSYNLAANQKIFNYKELSGKNFGESTSTTFRGTMNVSDYYSIRFTYPSGEFQDAGGTQRKFLWEVPAPPVPKNWTVSISDCPGDFTNTAICKEQFYGASTNSLRMDTIMGSNIDCKMEPGKTYFLNLIYSENPENIAPSCLGYNNDTSCKFLFKESAN